MPRILIALALLLGGSSLSLFGIFLWRGSWELVPLGMAAGSALAWDALLCAAFFAQHSGMVRRSFRRRLAAAVPACYGGAIYAAASGAVLLLLLLSWQRAPLLIALQGAPRAAVRAVFLLAIAAFLWAVRSLRSFDPFGVQPVLDRLHGRQPRPLPLSIAGPYRCVRHPLYSCLIVAIWACPAIPADRLLFNLLWTAWIVVGARLEERDLLAEFGEEYREYQRKVPMLVPRRRPPQLSS